MSRIISYPYDDSIKAKDAWVGTDEASRQTKQYTAEALAEYLNISGSISIIGQMTYKYGTTPLNGIGTLAVFGGGSDIVAFSAVAKLTLSNQDISNQRVVEFLDLLVGSDILIAEQGAISTFGYYSIDSYAINATDSNYYDLGVTFKSGNGSMRSDRIYEAQNFVLANDATQSPWNTVPDGISYTAANVGIGTTTPGHKLEVVGGNVHFQNTESSNTFLDVQGDDANAYIRAHSGSNSVWLYQGGSSSYLQAQAGSTLRLGSGTSNLVITNTSGEVMRISGSNVGIGTTNPSEKLEVSGGIKGDALFLSDGGDYEVKLLTGNITTNHTFTFPDTEGTLAITSDIPSASQWDDVTGGINYANGNVGIGTTSPTGKLEVAGTTFINDGILKITQNAVTNYYASNKMHSYGTYYDWKFAGSNVMRITSAGNVGIGTTNPLTKLEIISAANEEGIAIKDSSGNLKYKVRQFGGNSYSTFWNSTNTEKVRITSGGSSFFNGGNVGIGTTSPIVKLDVVGTARFADVSPRMVLQETGNAKDFSLKINTDGRLSFLNDDLASEVLTIKQDGNVGIGTTSPQHILDVNDSGIGTTAPTIRLTNTANYNASTWGGNISHRIEFYSSDPSHNRVASTIENIAGFDKGGVLTGNLVFKTKDHPSPGTLTEKMRITEDGNVGIGTDSPLGRLQVNEYTVASQGNQNIHGELSVFTNSGDESLFLGIKNAAYPNRGWAFNPVTSGVNSDLQIKEHGASGVRMTIKSGGNVGIGTTSPGQKLEVDGQVLSDGYRLAAMQTAPATRNSAGTLGEIVIDGNHIYVCYATDSWSRVALDTSW